MKWALVCENEMEIQNNFNMRNEENYDASEMVKVPVGSIVNIIAYDGVKPYTPPAGCKLVQVADDANIGLKVE